MRERASKAPISDVTLCVNPQCPKQCTTWIKSFLCTSSFEEGKKGNSITGIERVTIALVIFSFIRVLVINKQLGTTLPFPSSSFPLMSCARFSLTTHFLASTRSASLLMMLSLRSPRMTMKTTTTTWVLVLVVVLNLDNHKRKLS